MWGPGEADGGGPTGQGSLATLSGRASPWLGPGDGQMTGTLGALLAGPGAADSRRPRRPVQRPASMVDYDTRAHTEDDEDEEHSAQMDSSRVRRLLGWESPW